MKTVLVLFGAILAAGCAFQAQLNNIAGSFVFISLITFFYIVIYAADNGRLP